MVSGLVIAGNANQYENWLRENGLQPRDYKYITKREDYTGYHNLPVFLVGEYYKNYCYIALMCFNEIGYLQDGK